MSTARNYKKFRKFNEDIAYSIWRLIYCDGCEQTKLHYSTTDDLEEVVLCWRCGMRYYKYRSPYYVAKRKLKNKLWAAKCLMR